MSTVYYLVKPEDREAASKLKDIGGLLEAITKNMFEQHFAQLSEYVEECRDDVVRKIHSALDYAEAPSIDFCVYTASGYHFREFGNIRGLKRWLSEQEEEGRKYIIVDEYDKIVSIEEFERWVNTWPNG